MPNALATASPGALLLIGFAAGVVVTVWTARFLFAKYGRR